jgi:hypothetical protein
MTHAFVWLPTPYRWALLIVVLIAMALFVIKLSSQGASLRVGAAPDGIISKTPPPA